MHDDRWSLRAADFVHLWTTAYPRVIGRLWNGELDAPRFLDEDNEDYRRDVLTTAMRQTLTDGGGFTFHDDMAIGLMPGVRYECVVSDTGLFLPLPERPDPGEELKVYRMYVYRRTSDTGIRIPGVSRGAYYFYQESDAGFIQLDTPATRSLWRKLNRRKAASDPDHVTSLDVASYLRVQKEVADHRWNVRGSTLMGMMAELPRIIAQIWVEDTIAGGPSHYRERFLGELKDPTGDDENTARGVFAERLEIDFDPDFLVRAVEGAGDDFITPHGLTVHLPDAPGMEVMYEAWASGAAGNPVFTPTGA